MGYGKVGVSKDEMCSYKHTHNSAVHTQTLNSGTQTYTTQFTASTSGAYVITVQRINNAANCYFLIDDVLITHEEEVTQTLCEDFAGYRYGFNGQEKDNEISGSGNSYTAEFWQYDSRTGRRCNIDPVTYPWQSPYSTFNNNPIFFNDPSGAEGEEPIIHKVKKGENLTKIAKQFNTTVKQIVKDNSIKDPNLIFPGQELVVGQTLPAVEINAQEQEDNELRPLDLSKSKAPCNLHE